MVLLLSNDDGLEAAGLQALRRAVLDLGDVVVVAPEREQSARSHALTLHKPIRAHERRPKEWAVSGTPADCVYLGLHYVLDDPPELVISGINLGSNLGNDVFYSGTVAAAMEAVLQGVPAIAVSLHVTPDCQERYWETAQHVAVQVVLAALRVPPSPRTMWNVNVPNVPLSALRGIETTTLGQRRYASSVAPRTDPRGRDYFWLGGPHADFCQTEGSDGVAITQHLATVTPLHADLTDHTQLSTVHNALRDA